MKHTPESLAAMSDLSVLELIIKELAAERDNAWQELREMREAIGANPDESTADEVRRIVAERDAALHRLNDALDQNAELVAMVAALQTESGWREYCWPEKVPPSKHEFYITDVGCLFYDNGAWLEPAEYSGWNPTSEEVKRFFVPPQYAERDAALAQNVSLKKEIEFSANSILEWMPTDEIHSIACGLLEASKVPAEQNLRQIQADAIAGINVVDFTSVAFRHVEHWPKGFEIEDFRTAFTFISEKVRDGRITIQQGGDQIQRPIDINGEALIRCNAALKVIEKFRSGK